MFTALQRRKRRIVNSLRIKWTPVPTQVTRRLPWSLQRRTIHVVFETVLDDAGLHTEQRGRGFWHSGRAVCQWRCMLGVVTYSCALCKWPTGRLATTAEFPDLPQAGLWRINEGESGTEAISLPALLFSPVSIITPSSSKYCTCQKDKRAKSGIFTQSDELTEIGENRARRATLISVVLQTVVVLQTDGTTDWRKEVFFLHFLQRVLKREIKNSRRFLTTDIHSVARLLAPQTTDQRRTSGARRLSQWRI
jgi:hypothetical protein